MTKKQLYFIVAALSLALLLVLFVPSGESQKQVSVPEETSTAPQDAIEAVAEPAEAVQQESDASELPLQVTLEGEFLSLSDGENQHNKSFKYLLLHDGIEVLRIDLRPLIGYSDMQVTEKLGVERGDAVRVIGIMEDGEFKVTEILPQ